MNALFKMQHLLECIYVFVVPALHCCVGFSAGGSEPRPLPSCVGFSVWWFSCREHGLRGARALVAAASGFWSTGSVVVRYRLVIPRWVGSSRTRD